MSPGHGRPPRYRLGRTSGWVVCPSHIGDAGVRERRINHPQWEGRPMDKREFRERLAEGTLTRRQVATALASAGVVFMALPLVTRRARAAGDITYFTWSEYELPD